MKKIKKFCPICGYDTLELSGTIKHENTIVVSDVRYNICYSCSGSFQSAEEAERSTVAVLEYVKKLNDESKK